MTTDDGLKAALEASLSGKLVDRTNAALDPLAEFVENAVLYDQWPSQSPVYVNHGRHRYYKIGDRELPGVTGVIKASLGLAQEGLIGWAAKVEREAVLEAASEAWKREDILNAATFRLAVEALLGAAKAHQRLMDQAADLGTAAHDMIRWTLTQELGQEAGPKPKLTEPSLRAYSAWQEWWRQAGLKALRMEQPIYDLDWGYAGAIDLVAEHPRLGPGVVDVKTSKGVYAEHHIQVAAYMKAGRNFSDLNWGQIVRLPKTSGEDAFEVVPLGKLYDRTVTEEQLLAVFQAALVVFKTMVHKETS